MKYPSIDFTGGRGVTLTTSFSLRFAMPPNRMACVHSAYRFVAMVKHIATAIIYWVYTILM